MPRTRLAKECFGQEMSHPFRFAGSNTSFKTRLDWSESCLLRSTHSPLDEIWRSIASRKTEWFCPFHNQKVPKENFSVKSVQIYEKWETSSPKRTFENFWELSDIQCKSLCFSNHFMISLLRFKLELHFHLPSSQKFSMRTSLPSTGFSKVLNENFPSIYRVLDVLNENFPSSNPNMNFPFPEFPKLSAMISSRKSLSLFPSSKLEPSDRFASFRCFPFGTGSQRGVPKVLESSLWELLRTFPDFSETVF